MNIADSFILYLPETQIQVAENLPVTVAVFCYNQEKFIRDAILGVLAQTYRPLKVLISDDCSTDSSFEIIRSVVRDYGGSFSVQVLRNPQNLGLINSIYRQLDHTETEHIVGAAGDDISEPDRVANVMEIWNQEPAIGAICSGANIIDQDGRVIHTQEIEESSPFSTKYAKLLGRIMLRTEFFYGASGAWTKRLYKDFPRIRSGAAEDAVIGFRALMSGGIRFVNKPLVRYRKHANNVWSAVVDDSVEEQDDLRKRQARMMQVVIEQHIDDLQFAIETNILEAKEAENLKNVLICMRYLSTIDEQTGGEDDKVISELLAFDILRRQSNLLRVDKSGLFSHLACWAKSKTLWLLRGAVRRIVTRRIVQDCKKIR